MNKSTINNIYAFSQSKLKQLYEDHKRYYVTHNTVYGLHYSQAQKAFYSTIVYKPISYSYEILPRNCSEWCDEKGVNKILGFKLLNE